MKNRAVLITGGAKRVGAALALHFTEHGYDVGLHYHRSKKAALALQKKIESLGRACELFEQDLAETKAIPALLQQVKKAMPHCAALINNASIFERADFMETDEALLDRQFAINFKAPFFLTQAFARTFKKGCVINMLDTTITQTQGSHFAYLLSKKALAEFTTMAARSLGPDIRAGGVCPGILLPSNELDDAYMKKLAGRLPLKTLASLEDIASAALWLCENKVMTGQLLYVDGGEHAL